jgi:hypothetical protein
VHHVCVNSGSSSNEPWRDATSHAVSRQRIRQRV